MNRISKIAITSSVLAVLSPISAKAAYHITTDSTTSTTEETSAAAVGLFAFVILMIWIVFFVVALAVFIFWIFMLIDALKRTNWKQESDKNLWTVILIASLFVGLNGIAAILYYFIVRKPMGKADVATPAKDTTPPNVPTPPAK